MVVDAGSRGRRRQFSGHPEVAGGWTVAGVVVELLVDHGGHDVRRHVLQVR